MSRRSVFLVSLLCTWWIPLLLASVAVSVQASRVTARSTEYRTIGRIVAQRAPAELLAAASKQTPTETLESGELKLRTWERMRELHPELKKADVKILVTQIKGSSILNVSSTGSDPKYTRYYLEAFLDEFIGLRKEMGIPADQETIMQRPDPAVEIVPDLWVPLLFGGLIGGGLGVILMFAIAIAASRLVKKQDKVLPNPQ
ncbi:hypothetical protein BH11VER1_BH11VER1_34580 [soil metagenome]